LRGKLTQSAGIFNHLFKIQKFAQVMSLQAKHALETFGIVTKH